MLGRRTIKLLLLVGLLAGFAESEQRVIVRAKGGQSTLNTLCPLLGCRVIRGLDDPLAQVVLVAIADTTDLNLFQASLLSITAILNVELDQVSRVLQDRPPIPQALYDSELVPYFGTDVRHGYLVQPASQIIRLAETRDQFGLSGTGTVAVIDTGVDPNHPVLANVLLSGYDFTRNVEGKGSEAGDVTQSTVAVVDGVPPKYVNNYAAAVVDQSTADTVNQKTYFAFGHGTMVAGIIHLVAPKANIRSYKAFCADGSGYVSDVLRAIYRSVKEGVRVINMSFSMRSSSPELQRAVDYATNSGTICVASAGNDGQAVTVYPAAFTNVIGVASTTNDDVRSIFSNYGSDLVWVAAPGEGIVTTYPYGTYAAAWGTSFSTPLVTGAIDLLLGADASLIPSSAAAYIGQAKPLTSDLGHGRIDIFSAAQAALARPSP